MDRHGATAPPCAGCRHPHRAVGRGRWAVSNSDGPGGGRRGGPAVAGRHPPRMQRRGRDRLRYSPGPFCTLWHLGVGPRRLRQMHGPHPIGGIGHAAAAGPRFPNSSGMKMQFANEGSPRAPGVQEIGKLRTAGVQAYDPCVTLDHHEQGPAPHGVDPFSAAQSKGHVDVFSTAPQDQGAPSGVWQALHPLGWSSQTTNASRPPALTSSECGDGEMFPHPPVRFSSATTAGRGLLSAGAYPGRLRRTRAGKVDASAAQKIPLRTRLCPRARPCDPTATFRAPAVEGMRGWRVASRAARTTAGDKGVHAKT